MEIATNDSDDIAEKKEAVEKLKNIPNITAHHNSSLQMLTQDMDDLDIDLISSMAQEDPTLTAKILGIADKLLIESLREHSDGLDFLELSKEGFSNLYVFAKDISSTINEISEFLANE